MIEHVEPDPAFDENLRRLRRQYAETDWTALLGNEAGRRLIWELLEFCGVFQQTFTASDPYTSAFNEGKRNAGLHVLQMAEAFRPGVYAEMMKEAREHRALIETAAKSA